MKLSRNAILFSLSSALLLSASNVFAEVSARLPETPYGLDGGDREAGGSGGSGDPILDPCPTGAIDTISFREHFDSGWITFNGANARYDEARGIYYTDYRIGDGGRYGVVTLACARNPDIDDALIGGGSPEIFYDWGWTRPRDGSDGRTTNQRLNTADIVSSTSGHNNACYNCGVIRDIRGCFPPGVQIAVDGAGNSKAIEEVSTGDQLWNPVLNKQVKVLRVIEGPEPLPIVEVHFGDSSVKMSQGHPVKTEHGIKAAKALTLADKVLGTDGTYYPVSSLTALPVREGQKVINVVMEGSSAEDPDNGMISAQGLVTGDFVVQQAIDK